MSFIAWAIGFAFTAAVVFSAIAAAFDQDAESPEDHRWGAALGVGIGYLLAHSMIGEWYSNDRPIEAWKSLQHWYHEGGSFPLFPLNAYDWLVWIVVASTILGVLDARWPVPRWARWQNRAMLTGLLVWLLLSWRVGAGWEPGEAGRWMMGFGLTIFTLWTLLEMRAERLGPSMPLVLIVPASGLAVAQFVSGSLIFAALSGALASAMGAIWIVSWFSPRMNLSRSVIPTYSMVFSGLILSGVFLGELPSASAILFAIAPLLTLVDRVGFVARLGQRQSDDGDEPSEQRSGWKITLVRVVVLVIAIGIALGIAYAFSKGSALSQYESDA